MHASRVDSSMQTVATGSSAQCSDAVAELTSRQRQQVGGFVTFLLQQNEKMNLTGGVSACCPSTCCSQHATKQLIHASDMHETHPSCAVPRHASRNPCMSS